MDFSDGGASLEEDHDISVLGSIYWIRNKEFIQFFSGIQWIPLTKGQ